MSDVLTHKYVLTWKIKNFLSSHIVYPNRLESPIFHLKNLRVPDWVLWLYPKGNEESENSQGRILVFFARKRPDDHSKSIVLDITVEMFNRDGCVVMRKSDENCEIKQSKYWGEYFQATKELNELMKGWSEDTLIIRCSITTSAVLKKEDGLQPFEYEAVTVIDIDRFIFKWDVSTTGCFDWSENVSFPNSTMQNFEITLCAESNETVKINIRRLKEYSQNKLVVFRIKFLSASGIELNSVCETHLFGNTNNSLVLPTVLNMKDLYFGDYSLFSFNYSVIMECIVSKNSISWSKIEKLTTNSSVKKESTSLASFSTALLSDFRELFLSKKHSDVTLRINNVDFLAHKVVLASRSPVFSAMFNQDMLENQSGIVNIENMSENTLKNLLEYMYTDVVNDMDCEGVLSLLIAADKYNIPNLKDKCTSLIVSFLSTENVCEVIMVADMINHESLKTLALNVICENASEVLSKPEWCLWMKENMSLATEIFIKLSEHLRHDEK